MLPLIPPAVEGLGFLASAAAAAWAAHQLTKDETCRADTDSCKGIRKQLEKHEKKLQDYLNDPLSHDNRGITW